MLILDIKILGGIRMKKILLLVFVVLSVLMCSEKKEEVKKEVAKVVEKKGSDFEIISQYRAVGYVEIISQHRAVGYVNAWQSFAVYTNSKDKNEMVAYAKTLDYAEGGQTFVYFFNNKNKTPLIGQASTVDTGLWLKGATEYYEYMLGAYHIYPNKKMEWYEKDEIAKEDGKAEELK